MLVKTIDGTPDAVKVARPETIDGTPDAVKVARPV